MKKMFLITLFLIGSFILVRTYAIKMYISHNMDYDIGIEEIKISSLKEYNFSYENLFKMYGHEKNNGWTEQLKQQVQGNEDAYVLVSIRYIVKNNTENIIMQKIEFPLLLQKEIKKSVKAYNVNHDTYLLNASPGLTSGMTQVILIEKTELSENEIIEKMLQSEVIVGWNAGLQKNNYEVWANTRQRKKIKIQNALNNYTNNSLLFGKDIR